MKYERLTQGKITKDDTTLIRNVYGDILMSQDVFDMFANVYNRLAELEDDLESGKIIRLPCKVGDTVYVIEQDWDEDCKNFYVITEDQFMVSHLDYFGTWCFLTREEAEAKLKELQNG